MQNFSKEFLVSLAFYVEEIKNSPDEVIFSERELEDDDGFDHSFFYIEKGKYKFKKEWLFILICTKSIILCRPIIRERDIF